MGMIPILEKQYPEGSDITIYNTYYQYPIFEDGKKKQDDFIVITYRDNVKKEKKYQIIKNPEYSYYLLNDDQEVPDYNKLFIERDKVHQVDVPFQKLEESIAKNTGNMDYYKDNLYSGNKRENQKLHTDHRVFFSDMNIENHYRFKFAQTYQNTVHKLNKGYFDIEVDGKFAAGDFVEMGECPINCVTFLDMQTVTAHTFILRDKRNPLIRKFEMEVNSNMFGYQEIYQFITNAVGGKKKMAKYGLENIKFELHFFDEEIELIKALFLTMHYCSPDFIMGWNSSAFDLEYIQARIRKLGYVPSDIMCDPRWKMQIVKNFVDQRNINETPERGDYTFISGLPVFIDQMIQYASRRKAKFDSLPSVKLDDIGLLEADVQKLDYHHITRSIVELPWLDFKTFVLYNIMDVIVQNCIETQAQDLEYIFTKALVNNTTYPKVHRQTVYLINRMASEWFKQGYIIGTNCNKWNEKPPKFLGAIVGEPTLTNDFSKIKINGRAIWVCDSLIDFD